MPEPVEVVDQRPDRSKPKEYGPFECLLDRILVKGVVRDSGIAFKMADKYKEPQRWGEVIAIGDSIVLGGTRFPLSDFVSVGDLVKFGEHVAEDFDTNEPDIYVVRLQDCRGRRRLKRE